MNKQDGTASRAENRGADRRSGQARRHFDQRDASFLADASRLLADSLDYETVLETVAMLALPHLGAWCVVDVVEEDGDIRRVAVVHPDPAHQAMARELRDGWPPSRDDPLGVPAVARTRRSDMVADVDDELLRRVARNERNLMLLRTLGIRSIMTVPLVARDEVLGAITFVGTVDGPRYGEEILGLAEDLAARAAIAIDNARLYRLAERAREAAERASAAKSQFLGIMSHELRTPINAILGYTQLLEMGVHGPLTDEQRRLLGRVEESSGHLLDLVTRLLDMSKAEAGALAVQNQVNLVHNVVNAAVKKVRSVAGERQIDCEPDSDTPLRFLGDDIRARQILVNLLTNAVRFTEEDGTITIRCERVDGRVRPELLRDSPGPWVRICVEDDGDGIPSERLEAVFEPFVQGDSAPLIRQKDGTGLGLAVSRSLARLMGGDLTAVSMPGEGSQFSLWLPAPQALVETRRERRLFSRDADGLTGLADHILRRLKPMTDEYVRRLRADGGVPRAGEATDVELRNHIPHYLSGVASLLAHADSAGPEVSAILQGGNAIQRLTLELHGAQRHALGWSADAVRRDLALLREVVLSDLEEQNDAGDQLRSVSGVLKRVFDQAERISLQGWTYARSDNPSDANAADPAPDLPHTDR